MSFSHLAMPAMPQAIGYVGEAADPSGIALGTPAAPQEVISKATVNPPFLGVGDGAGIIMAALPVWETGPGSWGESGGMAEATTPGQPYGMSGNTPDNNPPLTAVSPPPDMWYYANG